jgi:multicomponent Na+:H+ antiporter subunit F
MDLFISPFPWAFTTAYIILSAALVGSVFRLLTGPTHYDRIVASDLIAAVVMCLSGVIALDTGRRIFFDIALAIAVIAFLGAVAFARHLERLALDDPENNAGRNESGEGD